MSVQEQLTQIGWEAPVYFEEGDGQRGNDAIRTPCSVFAWWQVFSSPHYDQKTLWYLADAVNACSI